MKIKLIFLFLILHSCFYYQYLELTWQQDRIQFVNMKQKYEWLNKDIFTIIIREAKVNDLKPSYIASIITVESKGKNIPSHRINRDGSRDFGPMQLNNKHLKQNEDPRILHNPQITIARGCRYLKECLVKADGNKAIASRLYNQGKNGKQMYYRNWAYVDRVFSNYIAYHDLK